MMVDECKGFISSNKNKPFLSTGRSLAYYPLQATDKWRHKQDLPHPRDKYAAFMSTTDELVGRVLDHLEKEGLRKHHRHLSVHHGHSVGANLWRGRGAGLTVVTRATCSKGHQGAQRGSGPRAYPGEVASSS